MSKFEQFVSKLFLENDEIEEVEDGKDDKAKEVKEVNDNTNTKLDEDAKIIDEGKEDNAIDNDPNEGGDNDDSGTKEPKETDGDEKETEGDEKEDLENLEDQPQYVTIDEVKDLIQDIVSETLSQVNLAKESAAEDNKILKEKLEQIEMELQTPASLPTKVTKMVKKEDITLFGSKYNNI